jgi:hypothetical protein
MFGMIFHQDSSSKGLKNTVTDDMNGTEDVLWEDHEENSSSGMKLLTLIS